MMDRPTPPGEGSKGVFLSVGYAAPGTVKGLFFSLTKHFRLLIGVYRKSSIICHFS